MTSSQRNQFVRTLTPEAAELALYYWPLWARPAQLPPRNNAWHFWLLLAGRGGGKTRTGAETTIAAASDAQTQIDIFGEFLYPAGSKIALVGQTAAAVRDVMIEGESGILARSHPKQRPIYEPSKRRLTWPNGTVASCFSAEDPDQLRGPQHHFFWADELAAWKYTDTWDQLLFGLRLGAHPKGIITTTPRPTRIIRDLMRDPHTHVSRWSTKENAANLASTFITQLMRKYEGTTLGRQELEAEVLSEMPGALWQRALYDWEGFYREKAPDLVRVVVAIDPSATAKEGSNEAGIVAAGLGDDGDYYVLDDLSGVLAPNAWARRAVDLYKHRKADRVVAEVNNGGDMVETTVRTVDPGVAYRGVHAARGKRARAEPIAALYEQKRVRHVGHFPDLEDQCCTWVPGVDPESPDRLDALVWALTDLMENSFLEIGVDPDLGFRERETA